MKQPKKIQDPTEAALSAIQEALTLELDNAEAGPSAKGTDRGPDRGPEPGFPQDRSGGDRSVGDRPAGGERLLPSAPPRDGRPINRRPRPPEGEALRPEAPRPEGRRDGPQRARIDAERRAANDDRQTIGQLLGQLQKRSAATPYYWAAGAAALWVIAGIAFAFAYHRGLMASSSGVESLIDSPALLGIFAGILLPPLAFFGLASVLRRSLELQGIARSMTEVALRLAQPESIATETVVTVGQAVRREVAAMGDGVDRAISRAGELEAMVRAEVSILERAYEENEARIRSLIDELRNERHNIQIETERLREGIVSAEAVLSNEVKDVASRIHGTMMEASEQVTEILGQKGEHITAALARVGDSMIDGLTAKGGELIDRLQLTGSDIRQDLSESGDLLVHTLKSRTDDLSTNLLSTTSDVAQLIDRWGEDITANIDRLKHGIGETLADNSSRFAEDIDLQVSQVNTALRATSESAVQDFSARGGELIKKFEDTGERVAQTLSVRGTDLADRIETTGNRIYDAVAVRGEDLHQRLAETGERITSSLDRSSTQVVAAFVDKGNEISSSLNIAGSDMTERLSRVAGEVTQAIGARGSKVTDAFRETADMLVATIGVKGDAIKEMLTARLKAIEETITVGGADLAERLQHDGSAIARTMQEGVRAFDTTMKVHAPELVEQIAHRVAAVNENLKHATSTLDERLSATTDNVATIMDQRISRIEQTLDQRSQSLTETLATRTVTFARTISEGTKSATESLDKSVETLENFFASRSKALGDVLTERAEVVNRNIGTRAAEIASVLDGRVHRIEELVLGRLDGVATSLEVRGGALADTLVGRIETVSGTLRAEASEVERSLSNLSQNVGRTLTEHSEKVADALGTRLTEIAHLIDDKNGTFLSALERTSQRAVAEITATNTSLKSDVGSIIERLAEANATFHGAMSTAVNNLDAFSGSFARQVEGFGATVDGISQNADATAYRFQGQVDSLRDVSTGALAQMASLAERLEQNRKLMDEAARTLGTAQDQVDSTLAARRGDMDQLTQSLVQRIADVDARVGAFHAMLDQTFTAAQERARQIASVVSEATSGSTQAVENQLSLVRSAADQERERTAAALRETYASALSDVQTLFGETGNRFTEVAGDLKRVAEDVQQAITLAREEMKRGILELPAETEASAATMRRAVAEQIKALAELNEIVARQGQALDVVETSARTATQDAARASAVREASRETSRSRSESGLLQSELRRSAPAAAPRRAEPVERPAPRPAPVREAVSRETQGEEQEGWLTELLARASSSVNDDDRPAARAPQAPAASTVSLDGLSADIARMVDHQAAGEMWDRHNKGESHVFSRRLYTAQGQQAFDTLKRRYRADGEFRETVDRYVTEFERLMDQVSGDDRGSALAKTYLTSDTGKVYTMLAHAAGRLD
ncbi:hypothetical protein [Xanthobacter autotrophicus]|uniref:apolipoprotein A-IV repeat region-like domain-containing protein n=1 Tax=Xanthobacter autotrophicus TaxID=280 RepID=UPI003727C537